MLETGFFLLTCPLVATLIIKKIKKRFKLISRPVTSGLTRWLWSWINEYEFIKRVISNYVWLQSEPCRSNWTHIAFAIHLYFFVFLTHLLSYCDLFCMLLLIAAVWCVYVCICACLCDRMTGILQFHWVALTTFCS